MKLLFAILVVIIEMVAFYTSLDAAVWLFFSLIAIIVASLFVGGRKVHPDTLKKPATQNLLGLWRNVLFGILVGGTLSMVMIIIFVVCFPEHYA